MRVIDTSNMKRKKLCNHKSIDGKLCPEERQPMSGGMFRSKCKVHFAASNVASKQRLATKRLQDDDPENLELMETKLRIQSAIRMQACRAARLKGLESIGDLNVRRIATILDTIKNSKNYVIVPNAIADIVNISNISLAGSPQGIAFSGEKPPYLRWMQPIKNADYLSDILKAAHHVFPMCDHIVLKLLTSKAGDAEQATHEDFVPDESTGTMQNLKCFHFSAVISIQDKTELLIGEARETVQIPLYSMLFFRGDMPYARAGYLVENSRLFISASSKSFPESDRVFLHTKS